MKHLYLLPRHEGHWLDRVAFLALFIFVTLPIGQARAVVPAGCGNWYSEGGIDVTDVLDGSSCYFELTFDQSKVPGQPVDLVFFPTGPGTYLFSSFELNTIYNDTDYLWRDYHFALGTGFRDTFAPFSYNANSDPAFSWATSDIFTNVALMDHAVAFAGGLVPNSGGMLEVAVAVDVPEGFQGDFTLRQSFSVLEPATVVLTGFGLGGLGLMRRRKQLSV